MSTMRLAFTICAAGSLLGACDSGDRETAAAPEAPPKAASAPATYDAEAFFATTSYFLGGGHAWSPDDQELLISSDESGIYNVYSLAAADGQEKPLTSSTTDSTFAVSWFPDDRRVLFTADQGGNELDHLYVREVSGETRDLT
ncbi:MAG: TolB family protein, partial [Planctomycetaceae bacterium]